MLSLEERSSVLAGKTSCRTCCPIDLSDRGTANTIAYNSYPPWSSLFPEKAAGCRLWAHVAQRKHAEPIAADLLPAGPGRRQPEQVKLRA